MTTQILKLTTAGIDTSFPGTGVNVFGLIQQWRSRARQRLHLSELTTEQLRDIGISPEAAAAEVAKRFWQA